MDIADRRVLVVGASSGVGRDIGHALAASGARVAFAARRRDLTDEAARAAGDHCIGLTCDVRNDESCEAVVAAAASAFGGLDTVIYAAAVGPLTDLRDADAATWREALDINLVGASLVTRAAIDHLEAAGNSRALYLSSVSGTTSSPWPGLSLYAVSKAALERLVDGWRIEHPAVRFTSLVLGPISLHSKAPSTFAAAWDQAKFGASLERWASLGLVGERLIDSADVCQHVLATLTTTASVPRVVLEP
jgi:NAD(P)-dependent dehydrogenase (short-subunit alcohol dehydrogenase family)